MQHLFNLVIHILNFEFKIKLRYVFLYIARQGNHVVKPKAVYTF